MSAIAITTAPPASQPAIARHRSAFIDYLRCVAFLSVFVQHIFVDEFERLAHSPDVATARAFTWLDQLVRIDGAPGIFGVVLFFMISGYCITNAARRESAGQFAVRRVLRIYPLLVIALVLEFVLMRAGWVEAALPTWREFAGAATLTGDFFGVAPRLAGVDWTLRLEFVFYVTVGLGLAVAGNRPAWRNAISTRACIVVALLAIAALPAFPPGMWTRGYVNLFAPFLVVGAAFAAFERGEFTRRGVATAVAACLAVAAFTQHTIRPDYSRFQVYYLVAVALFAFAWHARGRFGARHGVYRLALLTYATYLFHGFVVRALERGLARLFPAGQARVLDAMGLNDVLAIVLFFVAMAALVACVEQPLVRWSKRLT